jgi:hypothetical protein
LGVGTCSFHFTAIRNSGDVSHLPRFDMWLPSLMRNNNGYD